MSHLVLESPFGNGSGLLSPPFFPTSFVQGGLVSEFPRSPTGSLVPTWGVPCLHPLVTLDPGFRRPYVSVTRGLVVTRGTPPTP